LAVFYHFSRPPRVDSAGPENPDSEADSAGAAGRIFCGLKRRRWRLTTNAIQYDHHSEGELPSMIPRFLSSMVSMRRTSAAGINDQLWSPP
jgi:hypothetical protein